MGFGSGTGKGGGGGEQQEGGGPEAGMLSADGGPDVSVETIEAARARDGAPAGGDRVEELLAEVAGLRRELADAKSAAEKAGRRAAIERALTEAGAIDLEITTPLVEEVLAGMEPVDGGADVNGAVRAVRNSKGFLFRKAVGGGLKSSSMAGEYGRGVGLEDLAGDARSTGDRSDLLRYLRARRS